MADDGTRGRVTGTATSVDDRLLVVNSQFDKRGGTPVEPFTVSSVSEN